MTECLKSANFNLGTVPYLDEFKGLLDREVNDFEQEDTDYYWVWLKD